MMSRQFWSRKGHFFTATKGLLVSTASCSDMWRSLTSLKKTPWNIVFSFFTFLFLCLKHWPKVLLCDSKQLRQMICFLLCSCWICFQMGFLVPDISLFLLPCSNKTSVTSGVPCKESNHRLQQNSNLKPLLSTYFLKTICVVPGSMKPVWNCSWNIRIEVIYKANRTGMSQLMCRAHTSAHPSHTEDALKNGPRAIPVLQTFSFALHADHSIRAIRNDLFTWAAWSPCAYVMLSRIHYNVSKLVSPWV